MSRLTSEPHWRGQTAREHQPPAAIESDPRITPGELLRILNRRRRIVIAATAIALACAAAFLALATPLYTATAVVVVDPHRADLAADPTRQPMRPLGSEDTMIESQALLIKSDAVLRRVAERLQLAYNPEFAGDAGALKLIQRLFGTQPAGSEADTRRAAEAQAIAALKRKLKVSREGKTFVINITATSMVPATAQSIANAVADAYFEERIRNRHEADRIAATWLSKELAALKSRVQASDKAVEEFRTSHNLITTKGETVNDQQLSDLNNQLVQAHVQTAEARAKYQEVKDIAKDHGDPGTLSQALTSNVIQQLRTQYAEIARNVADLSSKFGAQHPKVITARAQLREAQKLIDEELKRILANVRASYLAAKSREDALRNSLNQLQSSSGTLSKDQVRLRALQREADANRTLYESFLARYKLTTARENLALPELRIAARADTPVKPSYPKKKLVLVLVTLFGVGIGTIFAFVVDFSDRRVKTVRQAEYVTQLPTLAAVPIVGVRELARRTHRARSALPDYDPHATILLPPAMQPPLMRYALDEPMSLFAESVRAVRLAVQRTGRTAGAKTIAVSSSVDGEGKSTLAANLALSLAAAGARTILVDGDFRNPELSRSLCPNAKIGLVDAATGAVPLHEAVVFDNLTGLAVLPSPSWHKVAQLTEFAFSSAMGNLLAHLRGRFDFIVIDAPPLVPLVDARALAEYADGIVLTIRWDATPQEVITHAIETLSPVSERLLGTVLTRVDMHRLRLYDYYHSSSYIEPYTYLGQPRVQPVTYSPGSAQTVG